MTNDVKTPDILKRQLCRATAQKDAFRVLREAYSIYDNIAHSLIQFHKVPLACGSGCDLCCYFRVSVKAHEVLLMAETIKHNWSSVNRDKLRQCLNEKAKIVKGMTSKQQLAVNIQCPLLMDNKCSVYAIRPLGCRRHHSQDVSGCRYLNDHPDDMSYRVTTNPHLTIGSLEIESNIQNLFATAGYDTKDYELITSLEEALSSDKPLNKWWKKNVAFQWVQLN